MSAASFGGLRSLRLIEAGLGGDPDAGAAGGGLRVVNSPVRVSTVEGLE